MFVEVVGALLVPPLIYIVCIYIKHLIDCRSYPKGPIPLPFIGNIHLLRKGEPHKKFIELGKIYGDVFGFSIGSIRYVVVNNLEGLQEVLVKKGSQFAGRRSLLNKSRAVNGIINNDFTPHFKVLRKLASSSLKMYSDGLAGMEKMAAEESGHLHKKLFKTNGQPVALRKMIEQSTLNIICTILFFHRYEEDNQEFQDIITYTNIIASSFFVTSLYFSIPWLRYFPLAISRNIAEIERLRDPILRRKLQEHRNTYDENNLRDVTDALIKVSSDAAMGKGRVEKITDDNIQFLLNDFMIAGSETSAHTILWFIVYLLHWPEYQDKLYDEIANVTGGERYPCLNDRPMLPLMQAAIHETLRLSSVAPLGMPQKAMENSSICGKFVPKGALIIKNLWSIHHDENHWIKAMTFYPERWLDEAGEFNCKLGSAFLPFSAGPRSCLGETLAKVELFIFISRLIKDFRFEKPIDEDLPRLDGRFGLSYTPYDFKVLIIPRNEI